MTTILRSTRFALSFALSLAVVGCGDNEVTTPPAPGAPAAPGTPAAPATPGAAVAMPPKATPAVGSNVFNVNGQPNFQEKLISIGFTPDPTVIPVVSGGNLEVSTAHIPGTGCRGWVTARPDVNVRLTTVIPFLRIFNTARGGEDTTLIINKPDGSWVCADDVYGTNP
ncbi:MAG: hypothetical protein IPK60_20070 [Sandaracinaceae bacterium]|nr:hypothetical protein [Sandaracinaceae bacterium]